MPATVSIKYIYADAIAFLRCDNEFNYTETVLSIELDTLWVYLGVTLDSLIKATPTALLPVLSGIEPPDIRRKKGLYQLLQSQPSSPVSSAT